MSGVVPSIHYTVFLVKYADVKKNINHHDQNIGINQLGALDTWMEKMYMSISCFILILDQWQLCFACPCSCHECIEIIL